MFLKKTWLNRSGKTTQSEAEVHMNGCEMETYGALQLRMCSLDDDATTGFRSMISFHYLKVSSATELPIHVRASDADKDQHCNCQIIPKRYFEHDATRHQSVATSAEHTLTGSQ